MRFELNAGDGLMMMSSSDGTTTLSLMPYTIRDIHMNWDQIKKSEQFRKAVREEVKNVLSEYMLKTKEDA